MESLELPFDLIWEGKLEPLSPSQLAFANSEDILIFDNDFANELLLHTDILKSGTQLDGKKTAEEILMELQQDILDDEIEEADQLWLDQPMNLPIQMGDYHHQNSTPAARSVKVEHTAQLLREFNSVLDAVELTHLTPPQTPPQSPPIQYKQEEFIFPSASNVSVQNPAYYVFDQNTNVQSPCHQDIAHEMEVVEELVRSRAENLPDWTSDDEDDSSQSNSVESCSPRSESSYADSNFSNDDEWSSKPTNATTSSSSSSLDNEKTKRRTRPYGRSSEDKKYRKKEQNKNAATRYRKKKKAEIEVCLEEERDLQEINDKLQVKFSDVKREIKYLKSLMRDLYRAKGIL